MGKKSKHKQRRKERSQERMKLFIPNQELRPTQTPLHLPADVTLVEGESEPELSPYQITFEYYKDDLCGIDSLKEKQPLNVVRAIRKIGGSRSKDDLFKRNILTQPVLRENEYLELYKGLDDETLLLEHKIKDDNEQLTTARIFYELLSSKEKNLCRIIAITYRHFETSKR